VVVLTPVTRAATLVVGISGAKSEKTRNMN